jgi:hypothetical protein
MSRFTFTVKEPGEIEFTLTATLTLDEWQKIRAVLEPRHYGPTGWLDDAIASMVRQAQESYGFTPVSPLEKDE